MGVAVPHWLKRGLGHFHYDTQGGHLSAGSQSFDQSPTTQIAKNVGSHRSGATEHNMAQTSARPPHPSHNAGGAEQPRPQHHTIKVPTNILVNSPKNKQGQSGSGPKGASYGIQFDITTQNVMSPSEAFDIPWQTSSSPSPSSRTLTLNNPRVEQDPKAPTNAPQDPNLHSSANLTDRIYRAVPQLSAGFPVATERSLSELKVVSKSGEDEDDVFAMDEHTVLTEEERPKYRQSTGSSQHQSTKSQLTELLVKASQDSWFFRGNEASGATNQDDNSVESKIKEMRELNKYGQHINIG